MRPTIIRNVHRKPIGPYVEYDDLTDDCKEQIGHGGSGPGTGIDLGITGANAGEVAVVKTVDAGGKPTSWKAQAVHRTLTVTCTSLDGTEVTGQVVTVRKGSATGDVIGQAAYDGQPVSFAFVIGTEYHVSVDAREDYVTPSAVTGTVGTTDVAVSLAYVLAPAEPVYDESTGRYTNHSIRRWLDSMCDGLVYGVQLPLYDSSPLPTATKTGANAGMVLESSTEAEAGRNDYEGTAVGCCVRCNGGVDTDGMPYVTAIEGKDERFSASAANTFAITYPLYRKVTTAETYVLKEVTDTPREGFEPYPGTYTASGQARPYLLRACYMDSDGQMSSKSGTVPAGSTGYPTNVGHCGQWDFSQSKSRATTDGLTYYTYFDLLYLLDMMQIMLGVKAPRSVAVGCVDYDKSYQVSAAEEGVRRVLLTDARAADIIVGSTVSVGAGRNNSDVAKCVKVLSKEAQDDGTTAVNLDLSADINVLATHKLATMPWFNGTCDGVRGTFGARTTAALTNGKEPFRFQNMEFEHGIWTTLCDMYTVVTVEDSVGTHAWMVAPDVSACASQNAGEGWLVAGTTDFTTNNATSYIKDYAEGHGAPYPASHGGTSTTGMEVAWWTGAKSAGTRESLVGGNLGCGANAGVGCVASNPALSIASWTLGGRSSALGHSGAPAPEQG